MVITRMMMMITRISTYLPNKQQKLDPKHVRMFLDKMLTAMKSVHIIQ